MGVKVAKKEQKLGIRASSTCTLDFDDVVVPAKNVIGEVGKGYKVSFDSMLIAQGKEMANLPSRASRPLRSLSRS